MLLEENSPNLSFDLPKTIQRKLLEMSTEASSTDNPKEDLSLGQKIVQFYSDDNNMALYCVLPLLILVYGGCSVVYGVHKCRRHFRKKSRREGSKQSLISENVVSDGDIKIQSLHKPRLMSCKNRVSPEQISQADAVPSKIKMNSNEQVRDLLTDYEFFTSWVIAQKAADLVKLQGEKNGDDTIRSSESRISQNYGTALGGRKKKLVFMT
ncbi:Hypothetical predicted protein [Argonauta hians]